MPALWQAGGSIGEPTWHRDEKIKLATAIELRADDPVTDAYERVGINKIEQYKSPTYYWSDDRSEYVQMEGRYAVVRMPFVNDSGKTIPETVFEIVGSNYEEVHPMKIAKALDPIARDRWQMASWGLVGTQGERLFTSLKMHDIVPFNDDRELHHVYLTVIQNMNGKGGIHIAVDPIRAECWNKCEMILGNKNLISIPHRQGALDTVEMRLRLIAAAEDRAQVEKAVLEAMMSIKIEEEQAAALIEKVYALPDEKSLDKVAEALAEKEKMFEEKHAKGELDDEEYEQKVLRARKRAADAEYIYQMTRSRMLTRRTAAQALYQEYNDGRTPYAGTVHAIYNAITELADWRKGKGDLATQVLVQGERINEKRIALTTIDDLMGGQLTKMLS